MLHCVYGTVSQGLDIVSNFLALIENFRQRRISGGAEGTRKEPEVQPDEDHGWWHVRPGPRTETAHLQGTETRSWDSRVRCGLRQESALVFALSPRARLAVLSMPPLRNGRRNWSTQSYGNSRHVTQIIETDRYIFNVILTGSIRKHVTVPVSNSCAQTVILEWFAAIFIK